MSIPITGTIIALILSLIWFVEIKYLFIPVFVYAGYGVYVFKVWSKAFAGQRVARDQQMCPSNKQPPDVKR